MKWVVIWMYLAKRMDSSLSIVLEEEERIEHEHGHHLAQSIQDTWTTQAHWFHLALTSIDGLACSSEDNLYDKVEFSQFEFSPSLSEKCLLARTLASGWPLGSSGYVEQKPRD
jgi:hypothetical protein